MGLREDEVAPRILGMKKIISDESLRRALAHLATCARKRESEEAQCSSSTTWMNQVLLEKVLAKLWVPTLDITSRPGNPCFSAPTDQNVIPNSSG
jgi:hypothetical protein